MTLVAGVISGNKVILVGDRSALDPEDLSVESITQKKVFKRGELVFGGAESFRMLQLLEHVFEPPVLDTDNVPRYLVTKFVPELRELMTDNGFNESGDEASPPGPLLVGARGRLFLIQGDYAVLESTDVFNAIGLGKTAFFGAMRALDAAVPEIAPYYRLMTAIEASAASTFAVTSPFDMVST
jgi:hypothetical protein